MMNKLSLSTTPRERAEPTHQALKSAQTKARLVEATIRCLIKHGYSRTTTPRVAEEAGLSRGAMMHHFENGNQLMQATIVELHHKRLRAFQRAVENKDHGVRTLVRAYWAQLLRPNFIAFQELTIAARTDRNLEVIMEPVRMDFHKRWYELALTLFPEWHANLDNFRLALALSQNLLEGMAINRLTHGLDDDQIEPLLISLEQQIVALRENRADPSCS